MKPMLVVIFAVAAIGFGKKDAVEAFQSLQGTGSCVRQAVGDSNGSQIVNNALKCR